MRVFKVLKKDLLLSKPNIITMNRTRLTLLLIIISSFYEVYSQRLPHTFENGVTLKRCEMERCYEIFPTVPRRNLIELEMPELGTYYGYYKSMQDPQSNISYTLEDFLTWDEFPTRGVGLVRGYIDSSWGDIPVILGVPYFYWDTIKATDLLDSWTEIEPYSFSWYGMDEDRGVSTITKHVYSFTNGNVCKESYNGLLEGCATQRVGDSYNRHSHSWSRTVKGGYYFNVLSNCSNTFHFTFETPTIVSMKCTSSSDVIMDVQPVINENEYEQSYRKQAIQQIKNDLASNADVKKAKKNHRNWLIKKQYPKSKGNTTRYQIYKLSDDYIVLFPLVENHNPSMDYVYYIILQRIKE